MRLLTETEVAARYGVTKPCLRRWRHERRGLPFVKVGRLARYVPEHVEAFILANVEKPKAADADCTGPERNARRKG
jgi:excisionase family DNA binding protein